MTKLLFVVPPYFNASDYIGKVRNAVLPAFTIPYGILSMETYLKTNCETPVDIQVVDLNVTLKTLVEEGRADDHEQIFAEELHGILETFGPDIVGVSALFNTSFRYIQSLVATVKRFDKSILTIAGGGLPSAAYGMMLDRCPDLDAICKGEGELPLKALIDASDRATVLSDHKSWITREGVARGKVPAHDFIDNLDEIPQLNYEILDLNNYNSRSIDKRYANEQRREMAIHTSRGCPFLCVFCSNPSLHGRTVRFMSIERVVEDVRRMRDAFGMTVLMVEDDHFFHDRDRAKRLLAALAELDVRLEFPNGVAVYAIDEEVAELFSKAGVSAVALAVESGSDHVLNNIIKKPLKKKLIRPAVEALRKFEVRSHVFIVAGLPGEEDDHRQETLEMLLDNGFDWIHVYLAIPIFGSRLYEICVENGYIQSSDSDDFVATKTVINVPGQDPKKLEAYAYETQLRVNFIENYNMRIGRYDVAIHYMKNVCDKYPDHAFGQLYLARCYAAKGDRTLATHHAAKALEIFARDSYWRELAERYNVDYSGALTLALPPSQDASSAALAG
ncbi:radical SAM protein [Rhizobium sp. SG2393]|uniref:radical SAM protein n=1 Tax=Rhizobium sp. SG2393 TaxID=3276279 RepID=UPI00366A729B